MVRLGSVRFLNVGQGDAAMVTLDSGWTALIDGGRAGAITPFRDYLVENRPRIDLMVGTHFDADHLEGLAWLVEQGMQPARAMLPPQVHPEGTSLGTASWAPGFGRESFLLAYHLAAGRSLGEVYRSFERHAADIRQLSQHLARFEGTTRRWHSIRASEAYSALDEAAGIANEEGMYDLGSLLWGARVAAQSREHRDASVRVAVRGSEVVAREIISAATLKRLVNALDKRAIPWEAPAAPDRLSPFRGSVPATEEIRLLHIAPTRRFVLHYGKHVSAVWRDVFAYITSARNYMPTLSNQLSHVLLFEDPDHSVGISGDSGFQGSKRIPDSLATGWEEAFARVDLLHLPHHCGRWGKFAERVLPILSGAARKTSLLLYGSVGFNKSNPPGPGSVPFLEAIASQRASELYVANVPRGVLGAYCVAHGIDRREGPRILDFDARLAWSARGLDEHGVTSENPVRVPLS